MDRASAKQHDLFLDEELSAFSAYDRMNLDSAIDTSTAWTEFETHGGIDVVVSMGERGISAARNVRELNLRPGRNSALLRRGPYSPRHHSHTWLLKLDCESNADLSNLLEI